MLTEKNGAKQLCWRNRLGRHPSAYSEHQHPPPLPGGVRGQQHGSADRSQTQIRSQLSLARLDENVPNSEAKRGAALCLA